MQPRLPLNSNADNKMPHNLATIFAAKDPQIGSAFCRGRVMLQKMLLLMMKNEADDVDDDDDDAKKQDADHMDHEHDMKNLARQRLTCNFQNPIVLASTNRRSCTILPESIARVFDTTVQVSLSGIALQLVDVIFEKRS